MKGSIIAATLMLGVAMHGAGRTGSEYGYIIGVLAFVLIVLLVYYQDRDEEVFEERHHVWKANAMMVIDAARKYRGPANSTEERLNDGRKLDWFLANDKELRG